MPFLEEDFQVIWKADYGDRQIGHAHFWDRAISRRAFLAASAVATGAVLAPEMWMPVFAAEELSPPNPIKGGTTTPFGVRPFSFPRATESTTDYPSMTRNCNRSVRM